MAVSTIALEKKPLDMLQVELWVLILEGLDTDARLVCRQVCSDFTKFVDATDSSKFLDLIWNPYFIRLEEDEVFVWCEGNQDAISSYLEGSDALMICKVDQLHALEGSVILYCQIGDARQEYAKICRAFPRAVNNFGENIKHMTIFIHDKIPESYRLISLILLNMKNLKSLTVFCYFDTVSAVENAKKILKCHFDGSMGTPVPPLPNFTELTIFGNERVYSGESNLVPLFIFGYGAQIKKLYLGGSFQSESILKGDLIMESFPNVEQLKIGDADLTALVSLFETNRSANPWPMLKRISIKVKLDSRGLFPLHEFLLTMMNFKNTLECFHLQIDKWNCLPIMWRRVDNHNFPKVHDVRLPFHFVMDLAKRYTIPLHLNQIRDLWPNMKSLFLIDMEEYEEPGMQPDYHQMMITEKLLKRLWLVLPETLEKITVRYKKEMGNETFHSVNLVYWKV